MIEFNRDSADRKRRRAAEFLAEATFGVDGVQGPWATRHNWPYMTLPIDGQILSIRVSGPGKLTVYERWGENLDHQPRYHCRDGVDLRLIVEQLKREATEAVG